jgi:galactokinase
MNVETITAHFKEQFDTRPEVVVRAPGRINVIGEHIDYHNGLVLPAAIDKAIYLAAGARSDGRFVFFAADMDELFISESMETIFQQEKKWANYLLGVLSELRRDGLKLSGLNIAFGGDIPFGAGLSSSAAMGSAMVSACNALFDLNLSQMDMVHLAQRAENNFVGMNCGIMDMFASFMGREGHVLRLDCRSLEHAYFPFEPEGLSLLLLDSGVKHELINSGFNKRREECEKGLAIIKKYYPSLETLRDVSIEMLERHRKEFPKTIFKRCTFVVEEIARVHAACEALQSGNFKKLGKLMFASHDGLNLKYNVCVPATSFLVELARGRILGARQMGGGFGGCTLNLLKTDDIDAFLEDLRDPYRRVFGLDLVSYPVHLSQGVSATSAASGK